GREGNHQVAVLVYGCVGDAHTLGSCCASFTGVALVALDPLRYPNHKQQVPLGRGCFGHGNGGSRRERLSFHVHVFDVGLRLLCLCGRALGIGGGIRSGGRGCLRLIAGGLGIRLCVACLGRSCLCSSSTPSCLGCRRLSLS